MLPALFRLFRDDSDTPICLVGPPNLFHHRLAHGERTYHHVGPAPVSAYDTRRYSCAWDFCEEAIARDMDRASVHEVPLASTKRVRSHA